MHAESIILYKLTEQVHKEVDTLRLESPELSWGTFSPGFLGRLCRGWIVDSPIHCHQLVKLDRVVIGYVILIK